MNSTPQPTSEPVRIQVGYVGLGAMGRELATHLVDRFDLHVFDLDRAAIARLEDCGAKGMDSLAALGACCDVVCLCLPKSTHVERVLFDEDGLASSLKPGSIVIDQTSGLSAQTRSFAERLAERGIAMIDAPVSGGIELARAGAITILASGDEAGFARARQLLGEMSSNLFHCGKTVGNGQALKAINNTINTANRLATLEIASVGRRLGLSLDAMTEAFNAGPAGNFITEKMLPAISARRPSTDFALELMVKDLDQGFDLAAANAVALPISECARALMGTALRFTGPSARLEDIVPFMERMTGASLVDECISRAEETGLSSDAALALVCDALAECNRLVLKENIALATELGMSVGEIAGALISGSARSAATRSLLHGDEAAAGGNDRAAMQLTRFCRVAARFGIPVPITSQARVQSILRSGLQTPAVEHLVTD